MYGMTPIIAVHAVVATAGLVLGTVNVFRRRRGDALHRIIGYFWVASMMFVAVSSFWIRSLNHGHFSLIHILSVVMIVSLAGGVIAARRHDRRTHRGFMLGAYTGLCGAFIAAVAIPHRLIPELAFRHPLDIIAGSGIALATSALFLLISAGLRRASR